MCLASDATNRVAGVGHLIDQRHPGGRTDNRQCQPRAAPPMLLRTGTGGFVVAGSYRGAEPAFRRV
jgi:hypothetical protein